MDSLLFEAAAFCSVSKGTTGVSSFSSFLMLSCINLEIAASDFSPLFFAAYRVINSNVEAPSDKLRPLPRLPKTLLKKNLYKYVPKELLLKEKQGFSVDLGQILRFDLKEEVEDVLNSKNLFASNIIDSDILKINVNDYMCGKNNNPWEIWTLFALNKFAIVHELV